MRELDELFTSGFRGAEVSLVESLIEELDAIETDTDDRQAALRTALYAVEGDLEPVDVMFLYRVIELTGEIADMAGACWPSPGALALPIIPTRPAGGFDGS